ncbi:3-phosphoserine/phosphohydroxythreonine transaminase [Blochmannia endosymbiont of Camponotus sp. C-003]|uniref:3-phosphoserine/phosphohydroxythreonine transaminase n=1 Tax=unclassified Candidatus Blochmanniella TaxID=711328 RepID=UPI0020257451|nr:MULTISPECIES: 3-phosphoserine/phosphohydroxythreonine transaminase [unclassified Candidatus Blochmannia]URJ23436.1 3-phosphoserine/phosphohydroxythreonine transaminase [Blochmannia endosymbiont of Camponotus sp. C-003]URJ28908.1 3-phosphoserine/phosphohydroxythreonine transaminase [Blochmannia endosymbiont of Camponotus sp. C-046]
MNKVFNFSAGPAMLPHQVLSQIKEELYSWNNMGMSVMEISHRSKEFFQLMQDAKQDMRDLLDIPETYEVLFCHGGARAQFSAIPMNLLKTFSSRVDYVITGYWAYNAAIEAKKYCDPRMINVVDKKNGLHNIQSISKWDVSENSLYVHYCPNETIDGIAVYETPNFSDKIVVADCSSTLFSRPINVNRFGIIYATAQKNIGISGLTVIIIRKDLLKEPHRAIPSILNYKVLSDNCSMFNTPVTMSWYVASLMFKWFKAQGGLEEIDKCNQEKSTLLYNTIDSSNFYYNNVSLLNRSYMNVPFFLKDDRLNDLFLKESICFGLYGLKGHKVVGGMRASLYNAMTLEGVQKLVGFMKLFSEKYC